MNTLLSEKAAQLAGHTSPVEAAAANAAQRFLRSLQVLFHSTRLYSRNHPHTLESLESAGQNLRTALHLTAPLVFSVDRQGLSFDGRPLPDRQGELSTLTEELRQRGISSMLFFPETHLGELDALAGLFETKEGTRGGSTAPPVQGAQWPRRLEEKRIRGIRINTPVQGQTEAMLTSLLVAVFAHRTGAGVADAPRQPADSTVAPAKDASAAAGDRITSVEQLSTAVELLGSLAAPLAKISPQGGAEASEVFRAALQNANPDAVGLVGAAMSRRAPRSGETLRPYLARLGETMALDLARDDFSGGTVKAAELRKHLRTLAAACLNAPGLPDCLRLLSPETAHTAWTEENYAERLEARLWSSLPPRQLSDLLRGDQAWCVPVPRVREAIEQLHAAGGPGQARPIYMNFAYGLTASRSSHRLVTASGLCEMADLLEPLWPNQLPEGLTRGIASVLANEKVPEVAALLLAVTETIARHATGVGDYTALEHILETLTASRAQAAGKVPQSSSEDFHEQLLTEDRWQILVSASLAPRPLDPSLPRILGRQPTRLLSDLGTRLSEPPGDSTLPAMTRLIRAIGDPAAKALELLLVDSRPRRAATAIRLLATTWPDRLLRALPRVLSSWSWNLQDLAVAEMARLGIPGTSAALLEALPDAHPLVIPMIVDVIGLEGEPAGIPLLLEIAAGQSESLSDVYVRIKAVEALGRMRAAEASEILQNITTQRRGLTYVEPAGLRAVAEEVLALIENRPSSQRVRTLHESVIRGSRNFTRPRRYLRFPLPSPLAAQISGLAPSGTGVTLDGTASVKTISLGGAYLESQQPLQVGDSLKVDIRAGLRHIEGTAVVRNVTPAGTGVEFVHMRHEDREKLRRLVSRFKRS